MGKAVELSESMSTDGSSTQSGHIPTAAELKCTCARWRFDPRAQRIKECEGALAGTCVFVSFSFCTGHALPVLPALGAGTANQRVWCRVRAVILE